MRQKSLLFVANWKMEMSINQSIDYCQDNLEGFVDLCQSFGQKIVLCPTFPALGFIMVIIEGSPVVLGAQNCSEFISGPYTGQVAASSLAQLGCKYCIIGHSEQRRYCGETDEIVARKARMLFNAGIVPIVCVGESDDGCNIGTTTALIEQQLKCLKNHLTDVDPLENPLIIAYEPVWAIGTGKVPSQEYLTGVYDNLDRLCKNMFPYPMSYQFLYGGSVNEDSIEQLKQIEMIAGFLIGSASLDFQKFKNLVLSSCQN